jgi:hypothetical protein
MRRASSAYEIVDPHGIRRSAAQTSRWNGVPPVSTANRSKPIDRGQIAGKVGIHCCRQSRRIPPPLQNEALLSAVVSQRSLQVGLVIVPANNAQPGVRVSHDRERADRGLRAIDE